MKNTVRIFGVSSIAALLASSAAAQTTTFDNQGAAGDALDSLEEQIADDADRNLITFGNEGRPVGSYGSLSLRATATNEDDDNSADIGVGLRYGMFDGVNGYDVAVTYNYGEDNGEQTDDYLLVGLDYRRDFSSMFFAFGQADIAFDGEASDVGDYEQDAFIGVGVGYRLYNTADVQWSVQAGPGYRVAEVVGEDDVSEAAASLSSNLFYNFSPTSFITNDTDVIYSDAATIVTNDLALNVSMTDTLSLRTGVTTRFNDSTDNSFGDARNTFGASVVYNFN